MTDDDRRFAVAERAARAGGAVALELFRSDLAVDTKSGKTDLVTRADRETQDRVVEVVREAYPDDVVVAEEADAPKRLRGGETAWVVDPIDGTQNYVRGLRTWATSVAAVRDGETVAAVNALPALGDVYAAGRDGGVTRNGDPVTVSDRADPETLTVVPTIWWDFEHRDEYAAATRAIVERFGDLARLGCVQAVLAEIAAGGLDGTVTNVTANPWDSVAGVHLVERAGGTVTDVHGDPWTVGCEGLVASNGVAHDHVLAAAQEITRT